VIGRIEQKAKNIFLDGVPEGRGEEYFREKYLMMARRCLTGIKGSNDRVVRMAIMAFGVWMRYAWSDEEIKARREILAINQR